MVPYGPDGLTGGCFPLSASDSRGPRAHAVRRALPHSKCAQAGTERACRMYSR